MNAKAQFVRRLDDTTVKCFLRLEGDELPEPVVVAASLWNGDLILAEKIERVPETVKVPSIHYDSVSVVQPEGSRTVHNPALAVA